MLNLEFWKWCVRLLPLLMILVIAGVGVEILVAAAPTPAQPQPAAAEMDALKAQAADLRIQADALKGKEDDLKWILGFILAVAGFFAAAQAASTWFTAQSFTEQAKGSLAQLDKAEKDVRSRFPLYSQMAEVWNNAFMNFTTKLEELSRRSNEDGSKQSDPDESFYWKRGVYEKMPLAYRRQLISAEQAVPYEIAGRNDPDGLYALTLRRLARFYWSKFVYEQALGACSAGDLEHAEYLLELAMRRIGSAFYLLNEKGNVHLESYKYYQGYLKARTKPATDSELAQLQRRLDLTLQSFLDSVEIEKRQLRGYFNLAYIKANFGVPAIRKQDLQTAIDYLRVGLRSPNWERQPVTEFTCMALYNLACYYARLRKTPRDVKACLAVLRKAAKFGMIDPDFVNEDFNVSNGDFAAMFPSLPAQQVNSFKQLERQLSRNFK
jgi:hypothetical protein